MYIRRQQIIRNRLAKAFVPIIQKVIQDYIAHTVHAVREKGVHAAQGMIHSDIVINGLSTSIRDLYMKAVIEATKKPVISRKALPPFIRRVLDFLDKFLLDRVVLPISVTTIKQIDAVLQEALNRGWGVDETVANLENSDITKWRAKMIVRTESARATNFAQMVAADQSPYEVEKRWIAVDDARTRLSHSHAGVDGEQVGLYEPYSNGLYFPGDPLGSAREVINCRCTQGFFAKRDLNGNIVPKLKRDFDLITYLQAA